MSDPASAHSASLHQLQAVAAAVDDALIVGDPTGRVEVWNAGAERLYGIDAADAMGAPMADLTGATAIGETEPPPQGTQQIAALTGAWRGRLIARPTTGRHVGREIVLEAVMSPLRDVGGRLTGLLSIERDITSAYRLEQEFAALGSLAAATGGARSRVEIAQAALEHLCRATRAPLGAIIRHDADRAVVEASHGLDAALRAGLEALPIATSALAGALRAPSSVLIQDLTDFPMRTSTRDLLGSTGVRTMATVGLHRGAAVVGLLVLGWRDASEPRPSASSLAQAGAHVERALENARLVEEIVLRAEAEQALRRRLDVLDELTQLGLGVQTAAEFAQRSATLVGDALGAVGSAYGLVSADGSRYETYRLVNVPEPLAAVLIAGTPDERSAIRRFQAGEASFLDTLGDATDGGGIRATSRGSGITAYAAIPVRLGGELAGAIATFFDRPVADLHIDQATLDAVARIATISLANFRLRDQLERSEARYRTLFEASPHAYLLTGPDGLIVEANAAAAGLYRLSREELSGRFLTEFVEDDRRPDDHAEEAPQGETAPDRSGTGRRADGSTFPHEVETAAVRIGGEPGALVLVRDLTERQRLLDELVQAQKMETVGILVSGVAHELNNPIAAILGLSELIRRDPALPPDLRDTATLLLEEADRARRIVNTFLDFIRPRPPERHPTPVRPLLDTIQELQSYSQRSGIDWSITVEPDLPRVAVDRSQLQQVLLNLTTNAIQAMLHDRPAGRLELAATRGRAPDGRATVRISVTDDGPGVPAQDRARLFVPFFTTKEPGEGTGLGLSVSFDIVRRHDGRLSYEPAPHARGARFVVELPALPAADATRDRTAPDETSAAVDTKRVPPDAPRQAATLDAKKLAPPTGTDRLSADAPTARLGRVLVLDDVESMRTLLDKALRRAGYETVVVSDGATAVVVAGAQSIDVFLVDHRMAGLSGIDVHEALVKRNPTLARRWIFMSGDVLNPVLLEFAESRGIRLLAKPFDLDTVIQAVRDTVEEAGLVD